MRPRNQYQRCRPLRSQVEAPQGAHHHHHHPCHPYAQLPPRSVLLCDVELLCDVQVPFEDLVR